MEAFSYDKRVNHLEVSEAGETVTIRQYAGDSFITEERVVCVPLFKIMMGLQDRGWQIRRNKDGSGRADIGRPTRIDFIHLRDNLYRIMVFSDGWTAASMPMRSYEKELADLPAELNDLKERGWSVIEWNWHYNAGARAWLGEPLPVRDRRDILRTRNACERGLGLTDLEKLQLEHLDLAFVL